MHVMLICVLGVAAMILVENYYRYLSINISSTIEPL
jgi:hypothetical protein